MDLTQEQIDQLKSLGINVENEKASPLVKGRSGEAERGLELKESPETPPVPPTPPTIPEAPTENLDNRPVKAMPAGRQGDVEPSETEGLKTKKPNNVFPLLSISGLTLLSFGGLVLLKGNSNNQNKMYGQTDVSAQNPSSEITPTQVPKSIQHYLLTSQQYFSQAVQLQNESLPVKGGVTEGDGGFQNQSVELLNNSILAATEAIKEFPSDYRGYQQRASIYQSLTESKPDLIDQSISDFANAYKLNPSSAEITRSLASLYAKKGDSIKTIYYLNQTVSLEPTKAQNFYDLATIQQQAGYLAQALDTYNKLIPLITDSSQKTAVESQKTTIEQIITQNPSAAGPSIDQYGQTDVSAPSNNNSDSPTLQASAGSSLIIAATQEDKSITVTNQTDSNSLSGTATLSSGQKEISISNDNVTSSSQVYVTATKGGKNQNLQVTSKSDKSFTVGLDSSIIEDIEFKWWIIN